MEWTHFSPGEGDHSSKVRERFGEPASTKKAALLSVPSRVGPPVAPPPPPTGAGLPGDRPGLHERRVARLAESQGCEAAARRSEGPRGAARGTEAGARGAAEAGPRGRPRALARLGERQGRRRGRPRHRARRQQRRARAAPADLPARARRVGALGRPGGPGGRDVVDTSTARSSSTHQAALSMEVGTRDGVAQQVCSYTLGATTAAGNVHAQAASPKRAIAEESAFSRMALRMASCRLIGVAGVVCAYNISRGTPASPERHMCMHACTHA